MDARVKPGHDECVFASTSQVHMRLRASRRDAPELCMNPSPKEGVGNAGCPLHPQPRVRFAMVKSTRVNEYTGITRRSRTQWF
jgi:hypothetical protein